MKRKQRYIRILCMIFVLSLLLSACSKPPAPAERDTDEPSTVAGSNSGSNSTTEEQPQDTAADADAASEPNITLSFRNIFSEGIAWAGYYDSNDNTGNRHFGWLHPDGSIDHPFPIDRVSNCGSEFSDGYSYVTTGDGFIRHATNIPDSFIILDKTGAITAESPDDGSSYEILCGGNGVYLVKQSIRSMTESDDRYGLITAEGDWLYECAICEPDGPHPLSPSGISCYAPEDVQFSYLGENIFLAKYDTSYPQFVFYNCTTNQTYRLTSDNQIYGNFSMGHIPVKIDGTLCVLSTEFELQPIAVDTSELVIYSDGIIFTSNDDWGSDGCVTEGKFYRLDGSVLANLSEYELRYRDAFELYRFVGGYAAIIIRGADNNYYLAILDKSGAFTFDPIKIDLVSNYDYIGTFSSGLISCVIDGQLAFVDTNGNITYPSGLDKDYTDFYVFHDGFALDVLNPCFLREDGTVLEVYLKE